METKRRHPYAFAIVLALCLVLATGCLGDLIRKPKVSIPGSSPGSSGSGGQPTGPSTPAGQRGLLKEAEEAQRGKRFEEALAKYEEFLRLSPQSDQADYALASAGLCQEHLGRKDQAITTYQTFQEKYPTSAFSKEVAYRLGPLLIQAGRPDQAVEAFNKLLAQTTKTEERQKVRIHLGRAHLARSDPAQALTFLLPTYVDAADDYIRFEADQGVQAALMATPTDELQTYPAKYGEDYPAGYVLLILAYRQYEMGNKGEAVALLDAFSEKFGTHLMTGQAQKARAAIDAGETPPPLKLGQDFWTAGAAPQPLKETPAGPATGPVEGPVAVPVGDYSSMNVAAILPLSENKWSDVGQLVLKGMKIAFKNHRPATKGFKSDLVVLDTKGNSDTAAKMVDDLSGRSDILAVVGPLLSAEAGKAAPKAQEKKIPMITVTQREGITQSGSNVFRLFLTPKAQAEAMARYAIGALGYGRLASLYPDDAYGRGMHGYFEKEVQRLGGRVVSSVAYKPDAKEFSEPIQKLAGVGKAARKVSAGRKVQVGFEAVFLPDGPSAVTMIAPQFPYHDIIKMKFLGSSLWHKPQLLSNTARYVQNCVVPTAFFPGVDRPEVKEFVELYRKEVNDPAAVPGQFEAYGYDAGRLLLYLMDQKHVSTRDQMIQELHKLGPFPGVTGRFQFDASGEYQVEPILITVEGEEFKPVGEK